MSDMRKAVRLYYSGEIFEAEEILKKILESEPDNINALARYAVIQQDLGRQAEADAVYLKIAGLYEKEGCSEECLEFLDKAAGIPQAVTAPLKGRCLYRLGRYAEALSHFIVSPKNGENLFYTGKAYFALQQYNNALRVFREILEQPANLEEMFRACYWAGRSLYALGELEEAISCFKSFISFYPGETGVYLDLALCCLESGRLEEAKKSLLRFRELGGGGELADLYLGIVHYQLGRYREAAALLDQARPCSQALHWKGLACYELGLYEEALQCFTRAAEQEAKPLYLKMMGNTYLKMANFLEAKICFEKAMNMDPEDEDLKKLAAVSGQFLKSGRG